ncbi:MAG: HAD family hydrolase [Candidatus Kaelpia imicola]|nr:HAD family hydrolase [Candidatus Kaelpia imicola]
MKSGDRELFNIKLIMFDLDGTLLDAYIAIEKALNVVRAGYDLGFVSYAEIKRAVGRGDKSLIEDYFPDDIAIEALNSYRQVHRDTLLKDAKLLPYAEDILSYLKERDYLLALGTNRPALFARLIIGHFGIDRFFDYVICGDEIGVFKPEPEMILETMMKFNLNPEEVIYIGDMAIDIETANNAGVRSIALTTGSSSREELITGNPFAIVSGLDRLKDFF